jgi:hypothetical protein
VFLVWLSPYVFASHLYLAYGKARSCEVVVKYECRNIGGYGGKGRVGDRAKATENGNKTNKRGEPFVPP